MIRGCGGNFLQIFSINHHDRYPSSATSAAKTKEQDEEDGAGGIFEVAKTHTKARVRLDATIDLRSGRLTYTREEVEEADPENTNRSNSTAPQKDPNWFQAYVPQEEDGCYLEDLDGSVGADTKEVCWWHMVD